MARWPLNCTFLANGPIPFHRVFGRIEILWQLRPQN
jgi:hypothetical protein